MKILSECQRIKEKIILIDKERWWGDDFDVRFFLLSQIHEIQNKKILDIGGGIGIICSELNERNFRINLDLSLDDLKKCKKIDPSVHNICASMTHLPFRAEAFDMVICSNLLEVGKEIDIENEKVILNEINAFPTVDITILEFLKILDKNGVFFLTTPNNAYYKSKKLTYDELNKALMKKFCIYQIFYFNKYSKIAKNRKLNMANIIPKLSSKFKDPDTIIQKLLSEKSNNHYSVSFFVKGSKR